MVLTQEEILIAGFIGATIGFIGKYLIDRLNKKQDELNIQENKTLNSNIINLTNELKATTNVINEIKLDLTKYIEIQNKDREVSDLRIREVKKSISSLDDVAQQLQLDFGALDNKIIKLDKQVDDHHRVIERIKKHHKENHGEDLE